MKITSTTQTVSSKRTQQKKNSSSGFGELLSSELQTDTPPTPKQQEQNPQDHAKQNAQPLLEQASQLLSQALLELEADAKPTQDTLYAIHELRHHLDQLSEQDHEAVSLTQAKTLLAVEAQRIQAMKY
ncbi:MAG: hypothetical protein Q9M18_08795 [Mariprofundaceae bacterium]|nr:hypothetical protein [Mariprofundaceae bacterium]